MKSGTMKRILNNGDADANGTFCVVDDDGDNGNDTMMTMTMTMTSIMSLDEVYCTQQPGQNMFELFAINGGSLSISWSARLSITPHV